MKAAYEVHNPSFQDINLEQQIEFGINDWCAESKNGHPVFGSTKAEAEANREQFEQQYGEALDDAYEASVRASYAVRGHANLY